MKNTLVRARIDADLKIQATDILKENGLEMSDAIRLFLIQVVRRGGLPFALRNRSPGSNMFQKGRRPSVRSSGTLSSSLANELDLDLLNEHRALSPRQRLELFLSHNRRIAELQAAGETLRQVRS